MKLAQYRLLSRILSGEKLTMDRYSDRSSRQIRSLQEHGLIDYTMIFHKASKEHVRMYWIATDLGRRRHAEQKPEY